MRKVERSGRLSEQPGQEGGEGGIPDISLCKSTRVKREWPVRGNRVNVGQAHCGKQLGLDPEAVGTLDGFGGG